MRLRQIQNFVTVVEKGSIRAAARELRVSQPAITKSVRSLEAELHVQLVQRTPHGVVPTEAGRLFFARARVAHAELRKAEQELAQADSDGGGKVAFGVGPVTAVLIAPQAITRFHHQFPRVRARVIEGFAPDLLPLVRDGSLDFAVGPRVEGKLDPGLAFRPLFREGFAVVARKGHPLRHTRSLAELVDADWLSFGGSGLPNGPLERVFSSAGLPVPRQVVQCDSYNIVVSVLAATDMLGVIARRMLASPLARECLDEIPVVERPPMLTVGLFVRTDPPLTQLAAAMAKAVTEVARTLARPA
ncbi:MAG: LysR family transcriptional regulator [Betaproteobacteria bacterium]|nr:LysR family transcriptional regulator [Betaproteobacteria bacterium]